MLFLQWFIQMKPLEEVWITVVKAKQQHFYRDELVMSPKINSHNEFNARISLYSWGEVLKDPGELCHFIRSCSEAGSSYS